MRAKVRKGMYDARRLNKTQGRRKRMNETSEYDTVQYNTYISSHCIGRDRSEKISRRVVDRYLAQGKRGGMSLTESARIPRYGCTVRLFIGIY